MDWSKKKIRRLNIATHRDLGYFFSALIIIYCVSGIALNHVDDWNADFIITKKEIKLNKAYTKSDITEQQIRKFNAMVGEENYKLFDFPTSDQVKIYYKDASLHLNFSTKTGLYESVNKRHVFYEFNVIHRNSLKQWKWASDIFAVLLILITVTGLFILKGKNGLGGRGKWLIIAGIVPPVIAIILVYLK
ncbi:PepSY-associated TM helix domain-containing protein [Runella sp.]|uniref:PepSY-associated TM helix domain-containing protein n=1 Tax=Runella sp. TaxID=1960881 RepID=UPI003D130513